MDKRIILISIILITFFLRAALPVMNERVMGIDSYFHIRSSENILKENRLMEY